MNLKNTIAILIFFLSGLFLYTFVLPFKASVVDPVQQNAATLEEAYTQATQQLSLKALRIKRQQLDESQIDFLKSFVPDKLHSGRFIYNLVQLSNQKRLTVKSIQYSIVGDPTKPNSEKKLLVELSMDGRYEDFEDWLKTVERSDVLMDVESIRGSRASNNNEIVTFYVKLYTYGVNID
jgi:Tfp pilus assembly protein PilO